VSSAWATPVRLGEKPGRLLVGVIQFLRRDTLRTWTNDIDPTTIPDDVLKSERARRNNLLRRTHSGGSVWGTHNPDTKRCRCEACNLKRERRRKRAALQPKRPRGRPRLNPIGA
jgi:hypothetical protein